jgi:hypothetical protein
MIVLSAAASEDESPSDEVLRKLKHTKDGSQYIWHCIVGLHFGKSNSMNHRVRISFFNLLPSQWAA